MEDGNMTSAGESLLGLISGTKAGSEEEQRKRLDEFAVPLFKLVERYFDGDPFAAIIGGGTRPSLLAESLLAVRISLVIRYIKDGNESTLAAIREFEKQSAAKERE